MCVPAEPAINEVVDPIRAVENYKRENKFLKDELALHDALISRSGVSYEPLSEQQLYEVENQCRRFIDGNLDELPIQNIRQVQGSSHECPSTDFCPINLFTRLFFRFSCLQFIEKHLPVSEGVCQTTRRSIRLPISRSTDKDVEKKYRERFILTDKHEYDQQDGQKVRVVSSFH